MKQTTLVLYTKHDCVCARKYTDKLNVKNDPFTRPTKVFGNVMKIYGTLKVSINIY